MSKLNQAEYFYKLFKEKQFTSEKKDYYEEVANPNSSINSIHADEIWKESIPSTPPSSTTSVVEVYDTLTLKEDVTVPDSRVWIAVTDHTSSYDFTQLDDGSNPRLKNWISPKYGSEYQVVLYDSSDQEVSIYHNSEWVFDYDTGILVFSDIPPADRPFKIKAYRYVGGIGITSADGLTGLTGDTGPQGPQGPQGAQGVDGSATNTGATGPTGPQGNQGDIGSQGDQGNQGDQGPTGPQGVQGDIGSAGNDGVQGNQGPTGPQGANGPQGFTGVKGDSGSQGVQGNQGSTGPQGVQGPQGTQGNDATLTGATGPQGNQGPQGVQGNDATLTGPTGNQGPQGPQGAQGNIGTAGSDGADGSDGAQGPQGPTGADGSDGAQGNQGPTGPTGATGNTGDQGVQGNQGPQGPQGAQGNTGIAGSDGAQGPQGVQGFKGNTGNEGDTGPTGYQGPQGNRGYQGVQGSRGEKGDKGNQGNQGPTGHQGVQGNIGVQGPQGPQGVQGIQGPLTLQGEEWKYNTKTIFGRGAPCELVLPELKFLGEEYGSNVILNNTYFNDTEYNIPSEVNVLFYDLYFSFNGDAANHTDASDVEEVFIGVFIYDDNISDYKILNSFKSIADDNKNIIIDRRIEVDVNSYDVSDNPKLKIIISTSPEFTTGSTITPTDNFDKYSFVFELQEIQGNRYKGEWAYPGFQRVTSRFVNSIAVPGSNPGDSYFDLDGCTVYEKVECKPEDIVNPNGFVWGADETKYRLQEYEGNVESVSMIARPVDSDKFLSMYHTTPLDKDDNKYISNALVRHQLSVFDHHHDRENDLFFYGMKIKDDYDTRSENEVLGDIYNSNINVYAYVDCKLYSSDPINDYIDTDVPNEFLDEDFDYGLWLVDKDEFSPHSFSGNSRIDVDTYLINNNLTANTQVFKQYAGNGSYTNNNVANALQVSSVVLKYNVSNSSGAYSGYWDVVSHNKEFSEIGVKSDAHFVMSPVETLPPTSNITIDSVNQDANVFTILDWKNQDSFLSLNNESFELVWDFGNYLHMNSDFEGWKIRPFKYTGSANYKEIETEGGFTGNIVREFRQVNSNSWVELTEFDFDTNPINCEDALYDKVRYKLTDGNGTGNVKMYSTAVVVNMNCTYECCWVNLGEADCCDCDDEPIDCHELLPDFPNNDFQMATHLIEKPLSVNSVPCDKAPDTFEVPYSFVKAVDSSTLDYKNNLYSSRYGWDKYDNLKYVDIHTPDATVYYITYKLKVGITIDDLLVNYQTAGTLTIEISENGSTWDTWPGSKGQYDECNEKKVKYIRIRSTEILLLYSVTLIAKNCGDGCCFISERSEQQYYSGDYSTTEVYYTNDIVKYSDKLYINETGAIKQNEDPVTGSWTFYANSQASGVQGPQGDDGPTGPQGTQGPQGNDGPQGPQGGDGPTGTQGATGPNYWDHNVEVTTPETFDSLSLATSTALNLTNAFGGDSDNQIEFLVMLDVQGSSTGYDIEIEGTEDLQHTIEYIHSEGGTVQILDLDEGSASSLILSITDANFVGTVVVKGSGSAISETPNASDFRVQIAINDNVNPSNQAVLRPGSYLRSKEL